MIIAGTSFYNVKLFVSVYFVCDTNIFIISLWANFHIYYFICQIQFVGIYERIYSIKVCKRIITFQ